MADTTDGMKGADLVADLVESDKPEGPKEEDKDQAVSDDMVALFEESTQAPTPKARAEALVQLIRLVK